MLHLNADLQRDKDGNSKREGERNRATANTVYKSNVKPEVWAWFSAAFRLIVWLLLQCQPAVSALMQFVNTVSMKKYVYYDM